MDKKKDEGEKVARQYVVYILSCADGTLYTGIATDVARRVAQHNGGGAVGAKYTRARRPVVLKYTEECTSRSAALVREHAIKKLSREEKCRLIDFD